MPARPHGAGRSRGRVRDAHVTVDLRRVPAVRRRRRHAGARACRRSRAATSRSSSGRRRLDDSGESGDRLPSGLRLRRVRRRRTGVVILGARAGGARRRGDRPRRSDASWRHSRASRSNASRSGIRSTTAIRWACSATTSRSSRAPAPCTPPRAMAPTTSPPASRYGLDIYAPIGRDGRFTRDTGDRGRPEGVRGESGRRGGARERGRLWHRSDVPALVSALLAVPSAGDLPGHAAVVHQHGRAPRERPCRRPNAVRVDPGMGPRAHDRHVRQRARTGASRGSARGACRFRRSRARLRHVDADADDRRTAARDVRSSTAPTPGTSSRSRRSSRPGSPASVRRHGVRARARHPRRLVRLGVEPRGRAGASAPSSPWPADLYLEGTDQYRGWFQSSLLVGRRHARPRAVPVAC